MACSLRPADRLLLPCAGHQRHLSMGSSSCSRAVCRHTPYLPHLALCCLLSCTWAISRAKQKIRQPDSLIKRIPEAAESLLIKISAHFRNRINSSKSNVSLLPNQRAWSLGLLLQCLFTTSKSGGDFLSQHYHALWCWQGGLSWGHRCLQSCATGSVLLGTQPLHQMQSEPIRGVVPLQATDQCTDSTDKCLSKIFF